MSEKLFYLNPELLLFEARVLEQEPAEGYWHVLLDRTAFYPEGGGHPPDRGTLNGVAVRDVQEVDGRIVHRLDEPLVGPAGVQPPVPAGEPSVPVAGCVDGDHRREFMQQHTGQHIVSACLAEIALAATVSAHLGQRYTTVELDRDTLEQTQLEAVETAANRIVNQNLPVRVHWMDRDHLEGFSLRKAPPAGVERLRLVEIPGHDASACGGLHVRSTGEVGLIQLAGSERIRGRLRLSWLIGERAYRQARENAHLLREVGRRLSRARDELPEALQALADRLRVREQEAAELRRRLGPLLAARLRKEALPAGQVALVVVRVEEPNEGLVEEMFHSLVSTAGTVAVLVFGQEQSLRWLGGFSPDVDLDFSTLLVPHLVLIDGRGGGRGGRWQGVGRRPEGVPAFLAAVKKSLEVRLLGGGTSTDDDSHN